MQFVRIIEDGSIQALESKCNDLIREVDKKYMFAELTDKSLMYNETDKTYVMSLTFDVGVDKDIAL